MCGHRVESTGEVQVLSAPLRLSAQGVTFNTTCGIPELVITLKNNQVLKL